MATASNTGPTLLKTLHDEIDVEAALAEEQNMLLRLAYQQRRSDLLYYLGDHKSDIEAVVSHHLNLSTAGMCSVTSPNEWIHGSFNICLPVQVKTGKPHSEQRVIMRFPLPYKIGELNFPGNADEKLRCEAATYVWIQENCPDVPVPQLLGFAFSGKQCRSREPRGIFDSKNISGGNYVLCLTVFPSLSRYIRRPKPTNLATGYLLTEYIEENDAVMLSESWEEKRHNKSQRTNLFRDLSRIMLSLGRIPLPRIGSFTLDDQGVLSLTNRPLTLRLQDPENEGVPTNIARNDTYTTAETYILDLLAYHDSLLRYRPNSINDQSDCRAQMAVMTGMRAVLPQFINRDLRNGPFQFTLTDVHQSNIFVDEEWYIKCIIDLEWACSLPMEMQSPPHWLTGRCVDQLEGEHLVAYNHMHEEFMEAFENEERLQYNTVGEKESLLRTRTMRRTWEFGGYFYFHALESPTGFFNLFLQHIWPRFPASEAAKRGFDEALSPFWGFDADEVTSRKMNDREEYEISLRALFEAKAPISPPSNE